MKVLFFTFLSLLCIRLSAQQGNYVSGGRAGALGSSGITQADEYAALNNIGALAESNSTGVFAGFKSYFGLSGLHAYSAGVNLKVFSAMGTLNFYKFGDELFSENKIGLGVSHKLGFTSLGIQANYLQYRIEGYGKVSSFVMEAGGIANPLPGLYLAGYVWNVSKSSIESLGNSNLQVIYKGGILYKPHDTFSLHIVYTGQQDGANEVACGIEYFIKRLIYLRTGFQVYNSTASFGVGFIPGKFKLDYAFLLKSYLGLSHQVSLVYQLKSE